MHEPTAKLQPISPDGDCADKCFLCVYVCVCREAKSGAFCRETIAILLLTHHGWRNSSTRPHTTCSPSIPHISHTLTTYWIGIYLLYGVCISECECMSVQGHVRLIEDKSFPQMISNHCWWIFLLWQIHRWDFFPPIFWCILSFLINQVC